LWASPWFWPMWVLVEVLAMIENNLWECRCNVHCKLKGLPGAGWIFFSIEAWGHVVVFWRPEQGWTLMENQSLQLSTAPLRKINPSGDWDCSSPKVGCRDCIPAIQ
jgi:hypothetical protein